MCILRKHLPLNVGNIGKSLFCKLSLFLDMVWALWFSYLNGVSNWNKRDSFLQSLLVFLWICHIFHFLHINFAFFVILICHMCNNLDCSIWAGFDCCNVRQLDMRVNYFPSYVTIEVVCLISSAVIDLCWIAGRCEILEMLGNLRYLQYKNLYLIGCPFQIDMLSFQSVF